MDSNVSGFAYGFERKCSSYMPSEIDRRLEAGYDWENTLYERITRDEGEIVDLKGTSAGHFLKLIGDFLQGDEQKLLIKQAKTGPGKAFYEDDERYIGHRLTENKDIRLKPGDIDLVRLQKDDGGRCVISICDIKSSLKVKLYHKIQVEVYCEFLESALEEKDFGESCIVDSKGYIWVREADKPDSFDREPIRNYLKESVETSGPEDAVDKDGIRIMNPQKCEGCSYIDDCMSKIKAANADLILCPGMTERDQEFLLRNRGIAFVGDLEKRSGMRGYVKENKDRALLKECGFFARLSYNRDDVENFLDVMDPRNIGSSDGVKYKRKGRINHPDFAMNRSEDVQVFLSAQYEQSSNTIPVFALGVKRGSELKTQIFIAQDTSREKTDENLDRFATALNEVLIEAAKEDLSVQGYVEDAIENYCLEKALYEYVDRNDADVNIRNKVSLILTWMRNEKTLGNAPNVGEGPVRKSVLPLVEVVTHLYYLSAYIAVDLETSAHCLKVKGFKGEEGIFNRFNGNVRGEYLYLMLIDKNCKDKEKMADQLSCALARKFETERGVIEKLRKLEPNSGKRKISYEERKYVRDNTGKYKCPFPHDDEDELIFTSSDDYERMKYLVEYEDFLAAGRIRAPRLKGLEEGIAKNDFIRLRFIRKWDDAMDPMPGLKLGRNYDLKDAYLFEAVNARKLYKYSAIVSDDNYYKAVPVWNDKIPQNSNYGASIFDINRHFIWLRNESDNSRSSYIVIRGIDWDTKKNPDGIVLPYFDNMNSRRVIENIDRIRKRADMRQNIEDLLNYEPSGEVPKQEVLFAEDRSQQRGYDNLIGNRVSAVIGPPGTGKTYFIVNSVAKIIRDSYNKRIRILLTANSWAAIDNMLSSLHKAVAGNPISGFDPDEQIIRLDSKESAKKESLKEINDSECPLVLGSTVWQIYRNCYESKENEAPPLRSLRFDYVIIDEATQVRMCDALIPLSLIDEEGKLLIVGDEDQLGSIIQGKYFIPEDKGKMFGSIFSYYYDRFINKVSNGPITQLNNCRRMNEVMTRYLADKLYGESYKSVEAVRYNSLNIDQRNIDEDIRKILDPNYQLTVCYIEGGNDILLDMQEAEKSLIVRLAKELQNNLSDENGTLDFKSFWGADKLDEPDDGEQDPDDESQAAAGEGKIAVITPYNRMNDEIVRRIVGEYRKLPFEQQAALGVDKMSSETMEDYIKCSTVDKFQGQERDVIIASYGVRFEDYLIALKEFLYNSNRMNVVISRARKKCIIILSDIFARRYKECYESTDDRVIKGSEFICGLKDYLRRDEPSDPAFINDEVPPFEYKFTKPGRKKGEPDEEKSVRIHVFRKGYNRPEINMKLKEENGKSSG